MKIVSSIKHQAIIMFASFAVGLSLMYLAFAIIAAFIVEDEIINRLVSIEAGQIEQNYKITGEIQPSRMDFAQVYDSKEALPEFAQSALQKGLGDNEIFTPTNDHFHIKELELAKGNSKAKTGYLLAEVSPLLIVTTTPEIFDICNYSAKKR